jgi:hypothetical protein
MDEQNQSELQAFTLAMYARAKAKWEEVRGILPITGECGFSILGSPPVYRPNLMIIGINPSVGPADPMPNVAEAPPEQTDSRDATWAFASTLRKIFEKAGQLETLHRATLANFLFFKARSIEKRGQPLCWADNFEPGSPLRKELEEFCLQEILDYIRLARPRMIMVSGLGTFDAKATNCNTVLSTMHDGKNRRLLDVGTIAGVAAFAIPHHTGSIPPIQEKDWDRVADWIGTRFQVRQQPE